MKIERMTEIETSVIEVGDRIHVGHYTATCQEITPKGALFLLDQYLDKAYKMNRGHTNKGGYPESDLRKALQSDEVLNIFSDIRDYMVPFDNGDLLRIPFAGELFEKLPSWCKPDGHEQWPLMQDRRNRLASRCGEYEWGWINNKRKSSSTDFCRVAGDGGAGAWGASNVFGVRPAFLIACKPMAEKMEAYKQRMVIEYQELIKRVERLVTRYDKLENMERDPEPKCPPYLWRAQLETMFEYMGILQTRAKFEDVDLNASVDDAPVEKAGWIPVTERLPEEHKGASDTKVLTKLHKLVSRNSKDWTLVSQDRDGRDHEVISETYSCPKRLISFRTGINTMTDEQKKAVADRFRKIRETKINPQNN